MLTWLFIICTQRQTSGTIDERINEIENNITKLINRVECLENSSTTAIIVVFSIWCSLLSFIICSILCCACM